MKSIIFLGATGAVGNQALLALLPMSNVEKITTLGRRKIDGIEQTKLEQYNIDIHQPDSYKEYLPNHDTAFCTLGVGQPSKVSREDFRKVDYTAVLEFAKACKAAGVDHFQLLASVGIDPNAKNYYIKSKGQLVEELKKLNFKRLSIFMPSMILTPENRYGLMQGLTLVLWPILNPIFFGSMKKYRGIKVENLGMAMAKNIETTGEGYEELTWIDFMKLVQD